MLGVYDGRLIEYDPSTLAPLGLVVGQDELAGRRIVVVPSGEESCQVEGADGGREVADALSMGERMTVLRELRAAIKPEVATWTPNVKDKVLCAGSWLPAGEEPVYEDTTVTVGDRTYSIKQCTQHCLGSGSRLWASAVALSRHLVGNSIVRGKCVIELGSGVGRVARVGGGDRGGQGAVYAARGERRRRRRRR